MGVIKISELDSISTITSSDVLPIVDSNDTTKKISINQLKTKITEDIINLHFVIVETLPTQDIQTNVIYLVPKIDSGLYDVYYEYIYINNNWELLGITQIDLSNYVTFSSLSTTLLNYATTSYVTTAINSAIGDALGGSY